MKLFRCRLSMCEGDGMEEWKEVRLGDYCDFQNGYAFKSSEFKTNGEYKIVKIKELKDGLVKFFDDSASVNIQDIKEFEKYKINRNDVLFALTGDPVSKPNPLSWVGRVSIYRSDENALLNQRTCKIKKSDEIDNQFLYYYFRQWENFYALASKATGSASQANISTNTIADTIIKLPPLPTQQKIAAILSSLDDKIELNNKINTNLEQQAGALFKNWFVDFEPFGTEEKIESPIGTMIPRSLRMVQVADIPHLLETGKRPKGGAVAEGVPSIGAENVKQLGVFDFSSNKFIPREYADALGKGKINGYELLLYKDGGKPGTFIPHFSMFGEGFPYDECYINEHVFKLDFYDKGLNEFAYFYFNTEYVKNWLANNGGKAAIPGINQNDVNAIWIYDLENPNVKEFAKFVEPLFKQIFSNCKQNRELSTIRDTLLPKLMNGEIGTNSNIISKE